MTHPLHLDISGMSCAHCVRAVARGLEQVEGVHVTQVGIGSADLTYDDEKTTPKQIEQAVEDAGYTAEVQP